ncbi:MAG: DUF58 domain-containing protein [Dehalococcoidia bacterium]
MRSILRRLNKRRSLWFVVGLAVFAWLFAAFSGYWLLFRLAYLLTAVIPLSYLWAQLNLRGLDVKVERENDRVQQGQKARERLTVHNRSILPKLWLEADDPSDLPGHKARMVLSLGGRKRRSWKIESPALRRGVFERGPLRVTTGDPFGLFQTTKEYGKAQPLLVYPLPLELPAFAVPPANLPGEGRFRRPTPYMTPNASSIRDYQPGDAFSRIHWPSTARTGQLMVKQFEMDPASDLWLMVDMEREAHAGEGDESTEEYAVTIAASVARYFLVQNRSLGFLTYGQRLSIVEAERGNQQLNRILHELALVRAVGDAPLSAVLAEESKRFGRHTTLVLITASTKEDWITAVQMLLQRGVRVCVVLLDRSSFGGKESPLLVVSELAASDVPTYYVRQGDNLLVALSQAPTGLGVVETRA